MLCLKKSIVAKNQVTCKSNYEKKISRAGVACAEAAHAGMQQLLVHHFHRGSASRFRERKRPLGNFLVSIRASMTGGGEELALSPSGSSGEGRKTSNRKVGDRK